MNSYTPQVQMNPRQWPCWHGAAKWLETVALVLATCAGERQRKLARIATAKVLAVAELDARAADSRTGRNVTTAHETAAAQLGVSVSTVRRARKLLEDLQLARTALRGRYMTTKERKEAVNVGAFKQQRFSSIRALLQPNEHLPRVTKVNKNSHLSNSSPKQKKVKKFSTGKERLLAAKLAQRLTWLRDQRSSRVALVLRSAGISPEDWTAADIVELIDRRRLSRGWDSMQAHEVARPLQYLSWLLRDAMQASDGPPPERRRAAAADMRAAAYQAFLQDQQAADAARELQQQPAIRARITSTISAIRAQLKARKHR